MTIREWLNNRMGTKNAVICCWSHIQPSIDPVVGTIPDGSQYIELTSDRLTKLLPATIASLRLQGPITWIWVERHEVHPGDLK